MQMSISRKILENVIQKTSIYMRSFKHRLQLFDPSLNMYHDPKQPTRINVLSAASCPRKVWSEYAIQKPHQPGQTLTRQYLSKPGKQGMLTGTKKYIIRIRIQFLLISNTLTFSFQGCFLQVIFRLFSIFRKLT